MAGRHGLSENLRVYGLRKKTLAVERGLSVVLAGLCVAIVAVALSDRAFVLPAEWRLALLILLSLSLLVSLAAVVAAPLIAGRSRRRLAVEVQSRFPELGDRVLSAVELSGQGQGGAASQVLVSAVLADAERATQGMDFRGACDRRPVVRAMLILSVSCLALAGYALVHPRPFGSCLRRLLDPMGGHPLFTYTSVSVLPGDAFVARGESVDLEARISGAMPDSVLFYVRREGDDWKDHTVVAGGRGDFTYRLADVHEKTEYSARAGDGRSSVFEIRPLDRPEVVGLTVRVEYPKYTREAPVVMTDPAGAFSVMKGGNFSLSVTPSRPIASSYIIYGEKSPQPPFTKGGDNVLKSFQPHFTKGGDNVLKSFQPHFTKGGDNVWNSGPIEPETDCVLGLIVEDQHGIRNVDPPRYRVTIREDEPPALMVEQPQGNIAVLVDETVAVKASACDDFGLVSLEMPFIVYPGERRVGRILLVSSLDEAKDLKTTYDWKIARHALEPGDRVEFAVEAIDNCEPDPNRTMSRPRAILVISFADHLERIVDLQERITVRLSRLLRHQIECLDDTESIALLNDEELGSDDAASRITFQSGWQEDLAEEAADITSDLGDLLDEMRKNRFVDESSMVEVASIGKSLGRIARDEMPASAGMLSDAASKEAASERRKTLADGSGAQHGIAGELRDLLDRLQRDMELTRLAGLREHLRELARRQRLLAADAGIVAPRTAGLMPEEIPSDDRAVLGGLVKRQERLHDGAGRAVSAMERVSTQLSFVRSDLSEKVDLAREFVEDKDVAPRMRNLAESIGKNKLFTCGPQGEGIASDLEIAADMLDVDTEKEIEFLSPSEIEELIRKQEALEKQLVELAEAEENEEMKKLLEALRERQRELARELSDALARARGMNKMLLGAMEGCCGNMSGALAAMGSAFSAMGQGRMGEAVSDQRNAAKRMKEALEAMNRMLGGRLEDLQKLCEAVRRIREVLSEQKELARNTRAFAERHGDGPHKEAAGLALAPVAKRQRDLKGKTEAVGEDWPDFLPGADKIGEAASEMKKSADIMGSGLTNEQAREAQDRAVAILEEMMRQAARSGAAGMASLRLVPMFLMAPGTAGGGYDGGAVFGVPEKRLDTGDRDWSKLSPRAREKLLEGWEESYPPEFRELLEIYFERIR